MADIASMTDAQIDVVRFKTMKKMCDESNILYPAKLVAYIARNGSDPATWGKS